VIDSPSRDLGSIGSGELFGMWKDVGTMFGIGLMNDAPGNRLQPLNC
jgi:hypothetical protein